MKIAPPQDREEHLIDKLAVPSSARRSVAIHEGRTRSSAAIRALTDQRHSTAKDRSLRTVCRKRNRLRERCWSARVIRPQRPRKTRPEPFPVRGRQPGPLHRHHRQWASFRTSARQGGPLQADGVTIQCPMGSSRVVHATWVVKPVLFTPERTGGTRHGDHLAQGAGGCTPAEHQPRKGLRAPRRRRAALGAAAGSRRVVSADLDDFIAGLDESWPQGAYARGSLVSVPRRP